MKNRDIAVIVLAAGKSTRMKSEIPKVLHPICGRPVLTYVQDLIGELKIAKCYAVLGYRHEHVSTILSSKIRPVIQKRLIGTADAVKQVLPLLNNFKGTVLVLYGDTPLLKSETINKLLKHHIDNHLAATLLTVNLERPDGYGRILRDKYSSICGIIEDKDASDFQKEIKEINTGIMCFDKDKLSKAIKNVKPDNRKKEYYLTDVIGILYKTGALIDSVKTQDMDEVMGINSRIELASANKVMQARINQKHMKDGVSIVDPASTFINYGTKIGPDTVIYPFTVIENNVKIGKRCSVGPFAHLREGACLEDDVVVGNFLEIVRSRISQKTWAKHFCYIGDSRIGRQVNIGAGTVTANFDNNKKNVTTIKDNAFIGCDTVIVAPATIGRKAKTGAGSVITKRSVIADNTVVCGIPAKPLVCGKTAKIK